MLRSPALEPPSPLLIFDCDGVLVDSEAIENQLLIDMAARHGVQFDPVEAHQRFVGRKLADCVQHMEVVTGRKLPGSFIDDYREELRRVVKTELKPVRGVRAALEDIDLLKCVASNGPREKIELALRVTGLTAFFKDRIFSAYDVSAWKPDPGIFLYAAATLRVPAEKCIVIEDSALGVQAAMAAGMKVIEYVPNGGSFGANETLRHMDQLLYVLTSLQQN